LLSRFRPGLFSVDRGWVDVLTAAIEARMREGDGTAPSPSRMRALYNVQVQWHRAGPPTRSGTESMLGHRYAGLGRIMAEVRVFGAGAS
jgi:hypothetical protein